METENVIDIVRRCYRRYGLAVNEARAFPSVKDGLKPCTRRVLYCTYIVTKSGKKVKSAKIVGNTIANWHPHSDSSLYDNLIGLYHSGYLDKEGNFGELLGFGPADESKGLAHTAAAMRYTECALKSEMKDLVFSLIDFVPFECVEMDEPEPLFLPTKLPLSFFSANLNCSIGVGMSCVFPTYKKSDLAKRLQWLLKKRKTEPIIKPFYSDNMIVDAKDKDCRVLLTTGEAKITLVPKITFTTHEVIIHERPLLKNLRKSIIGRLFKERLEAGHVEIKDQSEKGATRISITLRNRLFKAAQIAKEVKKELATTISFNCVYVDENKQMVVKSVDAMLLSVYAQYKELFFKRIDAECDKIKDKISDLKLIAVIRPELKDYLTLPKAFDKILDELAVKVNKNVEDVKRVMSSYTIKTLLTCNTDITPLKAQLKTVQAQKTEAEVLKQYEGI